MAIGAKKPFLNPDKSPRSAGAGIGILQISLAAEKKRDEEMKQRPTEILDDGA